MTMEKHFREIWQQLRKPPPHEHELVWQYRIGFGCPVCGNIIDDLMIIQAAGYYRICRDCDYQEPESVVEPIQMRSQDDWLRQFPDAEIYSYRSMPRRRLDVEGRLMILTTT